MEAFASVLADHMELLVDHLPLGGVLVACDPERIRTRAMELVSTSQEFLEASWASAAGGGEAPIDLGGSAFQPIADDPRAHGRARHPVVDAGPVRRWPTATTRTRSPDGRPDRARRRSGG